SHSLLLRLLRLVYPFRCAPLLFLLFLFTDLPTTEIYTLSLHDALPICVGAGGRRRVRGGGPRADHHRSRPGLREGWRGQLGTHRPPRSPHGAGVPRSHRGLTQAFPRRTSPATRGRRRAELPGPGHRRGHRDRCTPGGVGSARARSFCLGGCYFGGRGDQDGEEWLNEEGPWATTMKSG